jgi:transposase
LVTGGERMATVAKNLGLSEQTRHHWVKAASNGGLKSSTAPAISAKQMEISHLKQTWQFCSTAATGARTGST